MEFVQDKDPALCPVKWCRNDRGTNQRICSKHAMQAWRAKYPFKAAYANVRNSAKRRGIKFTITLRYFMRVVSKTRYMSEKGCTKFCFHLDRKDHERGYEKGNLQVITCSENVIKGNLERRKSYVPFFQHADDEDPF